MTNSSLFLQSLTRRVGFSPLVCSIPMSTLNFPENRRKRNTTKKFALFSARLLKADLSKSFPVKDEDPKALFSTGRGHALVKVTFSVAGKCSN